MIGYKDVASRYGVSERTIKRWVRDRKLKCLRLGSNTVRFRELDLAQFEEASCLKPITLSR